MDDMALTLAAKGSPWYVPACLSLLLDGDVCKQNAPAEKRTRGKESLPSTTSVGGEQFMLLDFRAKASVQGVQMCNTPVPRPHLSDIQQGRVGFALLDHPQRLWARPSRRRAPSPSCVRILSST